MSLTIVLLAGTIGMVMLVAGIIIFVVFHQKRMLKNTIILKDLESNFRKDLLQSTIGSQDSERERIAKDLHDEIGGLLSSLKLDIDHALSKSKKGMVQKQAIAEAKETLNKILPAVRAISKDLLPVTLKRFGLSMALHELCDHHLTVKVILKESGIPFRFDGIKELNFFRIVQELVNNAIRHSKADKVDITVDWTDHKIAVNIKDNGTGFDPKEMNLNGSGVGLFSIHSRAVIINAKLYLESEKGKGTMASIVLNP